MAENPKITVALETSRHLREGDYKEATDVLRHEGLKKAVEHGLHFASASKAGRLALRLATGGLVDDERLKTRIGNLELPGPIGTAPGLDKTGRLILAMDALGTDFQMPGAFTLFGQAGQRMPRLFTFDEEFGDHGKAISINRYGFYNPGTDDGGYNIEKQRERAETRGPVIAQITLNKEFYEEANRHMIPGIVRHSIRKMQPRVEGINLGLSSLNTKNMREAQNAENFLYEIIAAAQDEIHSSAYAPVELIVKGDGDGGTDRLDIYCSLSERTGCHLELINSTGLSWIKAKYGAENEAGGLAGADPDFRKIAVDSVRYTYDQVGHKVNIIGVGGVGGPEVEGGIEQAVDLMEAGASAVAFNTYFRLGGLKSFTNIKRGMSMWLDSQGVITSLVEAVGRKTKRGPKSLAA